MLNRLVNKIVVVTGGASGIGEAIVQRFAEEGATVWVLDLNGEAAAAVAQEIGGHSAVVDVSDGGQVAAALAQLPRVDVLVNNAGVSHIGTVETTTEADLDRLFRVNVKGVFHGLKAALPRMVAQGGGVVLNLCSIAARVGLEARFGYSMTKGAVLSMTVQVARDYVGKGIRCNCICPARVHTPFVDGYLARNYPGQEEEMFVRLEKAQPIGRMGRPEEVAALAAYLCSDEAAFVTGAAYDLDGGVMTLR